MAEECLICEAPIEYLQEDVTMECSTHSSGNVRCIGRKCPCCEVNHK